MTNALTIDLEDWYHGCCAVPQPDVPPGQRRLRPNTERILSLLEECGVKATFFVLGSVAAGDRSLVPMIAAAGHEVSSHGYSHTLTERLDSEAFRSEIRRTRDMLADQAGTVPVGFRAPQWSLGEKTPWALEILQEEGCLYDSSFSPLHFVGNPRGPRVPFRIATRAGSLVEFPPMVTPFPLLNLPTGGGWGFRFFPLSLIRRTMRNLNERGVPAVLYLHPRELDPQGPRLELSPLQSFVSYGPRTDAGARLRELLTSFPFRTLKELTAWQPA
jgi:peptidoglycan-N-acetylglucosamine deacetylase